MKEEAIEYIEDQIQKKLESLPRAVQGETPYPILQQKVRDIEVLKFIKEKLENE
jgi:hypothetical protein